MSRASDVQALMKWVKTQAASAINPDSTAMPAPNAADRAFQGSHRTCSILSMVSARVSASFSPRSSSAASSQIHARGGPRTVLARSDRDAVSIAPCDAPIQRPGPVILVAIGRSANGMAVFR
jgi:hypothetical protein